eukprot:CAMPEP_0196734846 /NCGR_PEP_ID=MMETSP1091-20130531/13470_1 /TAXON_ID=302021 /ORGANISM="Rhodomonas sp., Strain CCMP768" /LENGTH=37 /DNA_ID= /DNA_START= /DNA_END= /DNA_ORIENTATION=
MGSKHHRCERCTTQIAVLAAADHLTGRRLNCASTCVG